MRSRSLIGCRWVMSKPALDSRIVAPQNDGFDFYKATLPLHRSTKWKQTLYDVVYPFLNKLITVRPFL